MSAEDCMDGLSFNLQNLENETVFYLGPCLFLKSHFFRYRKKDHNPNIGGLGLGFREKTNSAPPPNLPGGVPGQASNVPARGPATDRLSAMKAAFKTQYQNQVSEIN